MVTIPNLNSTEKKGIALGAKMVLAKRDYSFYFTLVNSGMRMFPHVKLICDKLQRIADGEQHFYIVELPPQHGKSLTITKTFPSYFLMKYPDKHAMISAYSDELSRRFAELNRKHFTNWGSKLYGLHTEISTSNRFTIANHTGDFYATSILGGASGMSADLLIIDDPIKNMQEALSPTIKKKIFEEWLMTFKPRVQKTGSVIVIMTRWQTDDLAGKLLSDSELPWEEIKLPAISYDIPDGETDAIGRHNGEALCEALHSLEELKIDRHDMGSAKFSALYQQSPTIQGGNIFKNKWLHFYVPDRETQIKLGLTDDDAIVAPKLYDMVAQSWDATFKDNPGDDYVAGEVWKRSKANYFLQPDWTHDRLDFTATLDAIRYQTKMHPDSTAKYIEDKANGSAIINTLKNDISGIVPITPDGGKIVRASAVTPLWESGNVYLPHPKWYPRVREFIDEVLNFPNGPHDDYVDSMTQAINYMQKHSRHIRRYSRYSF